MIAAPRNSLPLLAVMALASCAHYPPVLNPARTAVFSKSITLYDHPLDVHFARLRPEMMSAAQAARAGRPLPASRPLLLYATGDGGWRGDGRDIFEHLAALGYPVAGFSARNYLKNLGYVADTTTPARLAIDYNRLVQFARASLGVPPTTPVVLVGVSRGAGLAVVAAGQRLLQDTVVGVLAIGLTKEEEYVRHYRIRPGRTPPGTPRRELVMIETYDYLPRLTMRVSVIQSTGDNYLPADKARSLFGPDNGTRQLHPIEARNHAFAGGRDVLYRQIAESLKWLCSR